MLPLFRLFRSVSVIPHWKRSFFPSNYSSNSLWVSRLSHEAFQSISARDLGLSILNNIDTGGTVSLLDYDIFTNKLHEFDVTSLDFIERIIFAFARTQSALTVLDSASHAIIRSYIDFQQPFRLMSLVQNRASTGIFFDEVSANLLLDLFLDQHQWTSAIDVVWELALQEYFSHVSTHAVSPATVASALFACHKLINSGLKDEVNEADAQTDATETDEVEYKIVKYIRNPNYDNLFDVNRHRLKLGFTLTRLSNLMSRRPESFFLVPSVEQAFARLSRSLIQPLRLLGLVYSDQLYELRDVLRSISNPDQLTDWSLSASVIGKLLLAVEGGTFRADDSPICRGEPVLPTSSVVESCLHELQRLNSVATEGPETFDGAMEEFIFQGIMNNTECMEAEIALVEKMYTEFASHRSSLWNNQLSSARKDYVIRETKQSLRSILDEEECLNYFKEYHELLRLAWLAPRTRVERRWSRRKEWNQDMLRLHSQMTATRTA